MKRMGKEMLDWTLAIAVAFVLAVLIRQFVFSPVLVEGQSMMPTLHDKDRMILNRLSKKYERFDIVVFQSTEDKKLIKRIIGLPGDKVEYIDDKLYINGKVLEEPFLDDEKKELNGEKLTYDFNLELLGIDVVPEGHYFVMGDNRRYSQDSRVIGTVSDKKILGMTNFIFWPFDRFGFSE